MGRVIKVSMDLAKAARESRPRTARTPRCAECPCYDAKRSWCPILASVRLPVAAMCEYGKRKRQSQATIKSLQKRKAKEVTG